MEKKIVRVDFTARDLSSGTVFDTTLKEVAEKEGIGKEGAKFAPMTIVLGKGEMHKALEEEIQKMAVGEQKKIMLQPEQAFGERQAARIAVLPLKNFQDNKMAPFPGLVFEANGMQGRVQSVSGGRVRVDFNHPLAGKILEYEIKLVKCITEKKEAIAAIYEKFLPIGEEKDRKFELKGEGLTIWVPKQLDLKQAVPFKKVIEKIMVENIEGIKKVVFIEHEENATVETVQKPVESSEAKQKPKEPEKTLLEKKGHAAQKSMESYKGAKTQALRKSKYLR